MVFNDGGACQKNEQKNVCEDDQMFHECGMEKSSDTKFVFSVR